MQRYTYQHQQQKGLVGFGCVGEMRKGEKNFNSFSMSNGVGVGVICPKPRRFVNVNDPPVYIRPSRLLHLNNQQMEGCESRARTELLDTVLTRGEDYGAEKSNFQVAFSPPFFSGSPPVRASNPVIQDEQFGNRKPSALTPSFEQMMGSPSSRGGGCVRVKNGQNPAPVRIEGFNCSRGNCRVSAVA